MRLSSTFSCSSVSFHSSSPPSVFVLLNLISISFLSLTVLENSVLSLSIFLSNQAFSIFFLFVPFVVYRCPPILFALFDTQFCYFFFLVVFSYLFLFAAQGLNHVLLLKLYDFLEFVQVDY